MHRGGWYEMCEDYYKILYHHQIIFIWQLSFWIRTGEAYLISMKGFVVCKLLLLWVLESLDKKRKWLLPGSLFLYMLQPNSPTAIFLIQPYCSTNHVIGLSGCWTIGLFWKWKIIIMVGLLFCRTIEMSDFGMSVYWVDPSLSVAGIELYRYK